MCYSPTMNGGNGEPSQFKSLRHMVLIPNLFLIGIGGECESMR